MEAVVGPFQSIGLSAYSPAQQVREEKEGFNPFEPDKVSASGLKRRNHYLDQHGNLVDSWKQTQMVMMIQREWDRIRALMDRAQQINQEIIQAQAEQSKIQGQILQAEQAMSSNLGRLQTLNVPNGQNSQMGKMFTPAELEAMMYTIKSTHQTTILTHLDAEAQSVVKSNQHENALFQTNYRIDEAFQQFRNKLSHDQVKVSAPGKQDEEE